MTSFLEGSLQTTTETAQMPQEYVYPLKVGYGVVLGCPRSGTTFLIDSLQAMDSSECISGHLYPLSIAHLVNQELSPEIYQTLLNTFEFSLQDNLECIYKERVSLVQRWLNGFLSSSELIKGMQGKRVIERIIYKEPFLGFAPELVYNALPNGRIVHIYRDGRDCADSLMRKYKVLTDSRLMTLRTAEMPIGRKVDHRYVPWWVELGQEEEFLACSPYVRSIWMWKEIVRRCHTFFSRPEVKASGRVLLIKYEDLVRDPLKWGEMITHHLGGSMNKRLMKKFCEARESSVGVYQRFDAGEVSKAEEVAETELQLYGYL